MTCDRARRLFGACWDDELTQAEREWLEGHFAACASCRAEYDEFSRTLELTATLPRAEAAPDLAERVLARVRRTAPAPDRLGEPGPRWAPAVTITASAAAVLVVAALTLISRGPWNAPGSGQAPQVAAQATKSLPALPGLQAHGVRRSAVAVRMPERRGSESVAASVIPDSLFDHSEDVEFILDPVTLHRGRALMTRPGVGAPGAQGQQAIITF